MRVNLATDRLKRCYYPRVLLEGIINKNYQQIGYLNRDKISKGDYVECISARMAVGTIVDNVPETNALRILILVDSVHQKQSMPSVIGWKVAIPVVEPYEKRTIGQESIEILETIDIISPATGSGIPARAIEIVTGLSLRDVEDHLDILIQEDKLERDNSQVEYCVRLKARGRQFLREIAMASTSKRSLGAPPVGIQTSLAEFKKDHPDESKAAFIMMRFGRTSSHEKIVEAIRSTLKPFGIEGLRADDKQYHDDVLPNIQTHIYGCKFGIAIFERIEQEDFNPNVSLEVGYLIGIDKPVCLLKDKTLTSLNTDLIGRLYRPFDTLNPADTIPEQLGRWLSDKGLV